MVVSKSDARGETTLIRLLRRYTHCHYADTRPKGVKQWRVKLQASACKSRQVAPNCMSKTKPAETTVPARQDALDEVTKIRLNPDPSQTV